MAGYRGFEPNAQAVTGLMDRFGGDGPPLAQPYLLDDYGTGVRGAFAVALGVYHRLKTGHGQHINISLAETATYHQAAFLLAYAGKVRREARGVQARGSGPLHRLYRASDRWFFVGTDSAERLCGVVGVAQLDESAFEARFAQATAREWIERLRAADIGAHTVERVEDLMHDPWVRVHGLSLTQTIDGLGEMVMPGVAARLAGTPLRVGGPVNPVGSDAPAILATIGLADRLDALVQSGAVSLSLLEPEPV
jgi:crotonobetainyl-CoA:carnitine CoA-transferase CaiB-like acyl-CoA transferase